MAKKYVLNYGFRRLSCCKKLGWKTIPAFLKSEGKTIELPIAEIVIPKGNTRINEKSQDMLNLMTSIKQNGLLEPIGVALEDELTEEDFLINNLIENLQRSDPTPMEQARGIQRLQENGLSIGEIAVRMSIPQSRVKALLRVVSTMPEELAELENLKNSRNLEGKTSFSILQEIASWWNTDTSKRKLLKAVKRQSLAITEVRLIVELVNGGMSLEEALENHKNYTTVSLQLVFDKKAMKKVGMSKGNVQKTVSKILAGKQESVKGLVYSNEA